jgi:hypothetical protein
MVDTFKTEFSVLESYGAVPLSPSQIDFLSELDWPSSTRDRILGVIGGRERVSPNGISKSEADLELVR